MTIGTPFDPKSKTVIPGLREYAERHMLNAPAKHGVSLGEHHDLMKQAVHKTARWKAWTDAHYHEIMLALMILDVILLTWIAIKK